MGFKVNTLPISLFAGVLEQWEQACQEAHDYAKNQLNVSTIETGFLGALFPSHTDAQNLVPKAMSKLPPLMSGCKDGLDGAKQLYDSTEKHEAERLDPPTHPPMDHHRTSLYQASDRCRTSTPSPQVIRRDD